MPECLSLRDVLCADPGTVPELELLTLVEQFGEWAPWVLAEDVLRRAEKVMGPVGCPTLAVLGQPGACAPLFVTDRTMTCLRPAFALPLRWERNREKTPSGACVPFGERVAKALGIAGWELRPLGRVDPRVVAFLCSEEFTSWDSAWVPIAIGLLSAVGGWTARAEVLATGAWSSEAGVAPVGYVREKVRLAIDLKAGQLLLPQLNYQEAEREVHSAGASLELVPLRHGCARFREVVSSVFARLPLPPGEECRDQEQIEYIRALLDHGQFQRARQYYRQAILPRVALRLREEWLKTTGMGSVGTLVTIASRSPETACYTIAACRPRRVLLLHDHSMAQYAEEIERMTAKLHSCSERPFIQRVQAANREELLALIRQLRQRWLRSAKKPVVLDLTPGTKEMTLELMLSVATDQDLAVYIGHELYSTVGPQFVVPYSERIRVWRC